MDKVGEDNIPSLQYNNTTYDTIQYNTTFPLYNTISHIDGIAIVYQAGGGRGVDVHNWHSGAHIVLPSIRIPSYPHTPPHSLLEICCENVNAWRLKYPEQIFSI